MKIIALTKNIGAFALSAFVMTLLSSCSIQMNNLNVDDISKVPMDHGLVVIGVKTNTYFNEIIISGTKTTKIDGALLKNADPYILVSLPEGNYEFSTIKLNQNYYINLNHSESEINWGFKVKSRTITYVGDFVVTKQNKYGYYTRLVNNSSAALKFLEDDYSTLLYDYKLVYSGSEKDNFFPYVGKLKGYKK